MRIPVFLILLLLFSAITYATPDYSPAVKHEFSKFFGEPMPDTFQEDKVELITSKIYETPEQMTIKMRFQVESIEKILLLNVQSNGYSRDGLFYEACSKEPVYIAGYTPDNINNLSELETNIRTSCVAHQVILMLWVKTAKGYYLDTAAFQTTSESPGE